MNVNNVADTQALQASTTVSAVEPAQRSKKAEPAVKEPSAAELAQMVEKANVALKMNNSDLKFEVDPDIQKMVVKVIDRETEEVLRQFPSREMVELSKSIEKMQGVLVSKIA